MPLSMGCISVMPKYITLANLTFQPMEWWNEKKMITYDDKTHVTDISSFIANNRWNLYPELTNDQTYVNNTIWVNTNGLSAKELKTTMCIYKNYNFPEIKRVIFNNPATIVYWEDGTKTVVKCMDEDVYSPDTGLAMCFMKKLFEKDDYTYMKKDKDGEHEETAYGYKKVFKKWIDGYGKD